MSFHYRLRLLAVAVLMVGLSSAAPAQARGTSGSRGTTVARPPTGPTRLPNQLVILSGNVITQDGTPLPELVSIERICNGRVSRVGHSDFQGYFSVTVNIGQYPDPALSNSEGSAETSGGLNPSGLSDPVNSRLQWNMSTIRTSLFGCELRGSLAGFRSSGVRIPTEELESGIGLAKVGTIVLERLAKGQGATVSATSLGAPKDARKAYHQGHHAIQRHKLAAAQKELEKAVQLYPRYAAAWVDLGWVYVQHNRLEKARNAFTQASAADDKFVPAYLGLSSVALRESKWAEAAEFSDHVAQLDGVEAPAAFYYNSLANYRLGNMEQAEKSARKAETLGVQHAFPQVRLLLGMVLANRREYAGAAGELRSFLKAAPTAPNADKVREQLAELEKLGAAKSPAEAAPPAK